MVAKFALTILVLTGAQASVLACTCSEESVPDALERADAVFAGTVKAVRMVDEAKGWEPRVIVDFEVARVWKGQVGQSFSLHTNVEQSSCRGMGAGLVEPGKVLIVYANSGTAAEWKGKPQGGTPNAGSFTVRGDQPRVADHRLLNSVGDEDRVYTTSICTRTQQVLYAVEDFEQLGAFVDLAPLPIMPDKALVESRRPAYNSLPSDCGILTDAKRWNVQQPPPDIAANLIALLEHGPLYSSVPLDRRPAYAHYWVIDTEMRVGFCRVSQEPNRVCGNTTMIFTRDQDGGWQYGEGGVSTYCPAR